MRTFRVRDVLVLALSLFSTACGGDGGGSAGPPRSASSGGGANTDFEEVSSDPGTCRKLCCGNADCASGESCQAVDPSQGTLGVCVPSGAEWPGSGGAAGSGAGGSPGVFSASCWSDPELECNPLDNAGCSSGDACDAIDDDPSYPVVVGCVGGEATKAAGESCDASFGPWCAPGYHCVRK